MSVGVTLTPTGYPYSLRPEGKTQGNHFSILGGEDRRSIQAQSSLLAGVCLLAPAGKRTIGDFQAELYRCSLRTFLTDEDVARILIEYHRELVSLLDSTRLKSGSVNGERPTLVRETPPR